MNPYNWQSHSPRIPIPRSDVDRIADLLRHNGSAVVLGGRGMGKSVFLGQLKAKLEGEPGTEVMLFPGPAARLTTQSCLNRLARRLGVPAVEDVDSIELFESYFARDDAPERLVLLFDEFDRYAEKAGGSAQPPGRGFFNDIEASRRSLPQLGLLAAGSIGVYIVRDVLGSSFLARALYLRLRPFERADGEVLVRPFNDRGVPVPDDVLDALFLASGGLPALVTYALQKLWELDREPEVADVTALFKAFQEQYGEYLRDLLRALTDPRFSDAPRRVWEHVQQAAGRIPRRDLEACIEPASGALDLDLADVLHLLEVVGVVRLQSSAFHDDPVTVHPIASLLNLPRVSASEEDLRTHFLHDLTTLLEKLHRSSADFFRPGRERSAPDSSGKRLVPESVFAAHLALGFELLGWHSEREAQRAAGRTDLLLRRNGASEVAVVEVKLWGRNDYKDAQKQVESYWTNEVAAGAVVQLTDAELPDWPERYRRECLDRSDAAIAEQASADSPVRAQFRCVSSTADGMEVRVDHFLLRLPRRP